MKNYFRIFESFSVLFIVFFISCTTYNFSAPQPVDKENIYEFPNDLQGTWRDKDYDDFFTIHKRYAQMHMSTKEKIQQGVWPRLNAQGGFVFQPFNCSSFYTARYDSMKRPIDTVSNYLLKGNKIYQIDEEGKLSKGYDYRLDNDTIILLKKDVVTVDLGRNAFLRKLNDTVYVINIMSGILGQDNTWWQFTILEIKPHERLTMWDCTEKLQKHPAMFYSKYRSRGSEIYYFDCKWTTPDLLHLMQTGYFEISGTLIRDKNK